MYPWIINLQLFAETPETDANPGGEEGDKGEESKPAEKMLPQSEVNRVVEERLARERKKHEPTLTFVERQAKKHGLSVEDYVKAAEEAEALESVKAEAEEKGVDPETLLELKRSKERLAELERKEAEARAREAATKEQQEAFAKQVEEFKGAYPSVDVAKLAENIDFMEYIKDLNPSLTLTKMYERYVKHTENEKLAKKAAADANASRSTGSGRDDASGDGTYGLNERQLSLAKENGMTAKQYADLMSHIRKEK